MDMECSLSQRNPSHTGKGFAILGTANWNGTPEREPLRCLVAIASQAVGMLTRRGKACSAVIMMKMMKMMINVHAPARVHLGC
jgi:hypothetical protein